MTLEEAIKHCYEVAEEKCDECGKEHLQLAKWLEELRTFKKQSRLCGSGKVFNTPYYDENGSLCKYDESSGEWVSID